MKLYALVPLLFQKIIWIPTRLILTIFGNLQVRGLEHLKSIRSPVIFAVNHSSEIDPFMVPASLPFFSRFSPLFYAVREKTFYSGNGWRKHLFNGWFINLWGGYSAEVGLKDYEKSLAPHISILRNGGSFCVFPEGKITLDGKVGEAKGGISFLAHSAPCTIIPVAISGVFDMSPADFFSGKRTISISYGKPIRSEDLYTKITQPHIAGTSVWKLEADFIMSEVDKLMHTPEKQTCTV